ncbi:cobalamin-independent methionine synthase catalytic subunit [Motilibacter rhizosphaerae]|uniref:Cobalamin-independent methionine synthase catalytic subunit n=2 Tax=Motilibacter rhizosphaerae TaxID=598652 RepID=A0A4Q7NP64_9ACTN|nr:cobalamin-independent methionine synthase catalytic subunit [Motilibacter rhizosphaerae]
MPAPLPAGVATGVGSLPGTDPRAAVRLVLDELRDLPHLPELPARGPGADLVGRVVGLLAGLHGDVQPSGWRLVPGAGRDERLSVSWLAEDLDALEELAGGWSGWLKLQVCGPVTLAASVELPRGGLLARDPGARRDVAASLAEGVRLHVEDVRRRLPEAQLLLQVDEPSLTTALAGRLPTASGFGALPALETGEAEASLRSLVEAAGVPAIVHSCAPAVPVALLRRTGAAGVSLDLALVAPDGEEALGEAVDAGTRLLLGAVPSTGAPGRSEEAAARVRALWRRLGFAPALLGEAVLVTPACGLAGATPPGALAALRTATAAAKRLTDDPEG